MSNQTERDGEESALNKFESGLSAPTLSSPGEESALNEMESGSLVDRHAYRFLYQDVDDFVVDYPPEDDMGCRRTYKISSSVRRVNLGSPEGPTYVFVQGKDSACIVRSLIHDMDVDVDAEELPIFSLENILKSLADPHFRGLEIVEKHGDLQHFAVVSVVLSPDVIMTEMEIAWKSFEDVSTKMHCPERPGALGIERFFFLHGDDMIDVLKEAPYLFAGKPDISATTTLDFDFATTADVVAVTGSCIKETEAVGMLQSKLNEKVSFTFDETIQTAISAIQRLYGVVFQENEIEVYAAGEMGRSEGLLARTDIGRHLAAINNEGSN